LYSCHPREGGNLLFAILAGFPLLKKRHLTSIKSYHFFDFIQKKGKIVLQPKEEKMGCIWQIFVAIFIIFLIVLFIAFMMVINSGGS